MRGSRLGLIFVGSNPNCIKLLYNLLLLVFRELRAHRYGDEHRLRRRQPCCTLPAARVSTAHVLAAHVLAAYVPTAHVPAAYVPTADCVAASQRYRADSYRRLISLICINLNLYQISYT